MIGLPLNTMVVFQSLQTSKYTKDWVPPGSAKNTTMRLMVVFMLLTIGSLVPNFGQLYPIVMAMFGPLIQCVFPIVFTYKIRSSMGLRQPGCSRKCLHAAVLAVACFTLTFGTYVSLRDVISP
mmetsp:Transcript_84615/g.272708  ORF Transcript_84615/g.272708 Transcript_84615/m.272708 type:complete len:123 (-) Transcript_84615:87-455(-)